MKKIDILFLTGVVVASDSQKEGLTSGADNKLNYGRRYSATENNAAIMNEDTTLWDRPLNETEIQALFSVHSGNLQLN